MKTLEELKKFYDTSLLPELKNLETERQKVLQRILVGAGVILPFLILVIFLALHNQKYAQFLLFSFFLLVAIAGVAYQKFVRGYVARFKQKIMTHIVRFADENLEYVPNSCIPETTFLASRIFQSRIDRYRGEDYVKGIVGRTKIEFSEIHAQYKTTSHSKHGTQTHWHTIFRGVFVIADFNKNFNGTTVVLPDLAERFFGYLANMVQSWNFPRGQLIKLEDPEFEKEFVVYGDDQVESRYILSPGLMKRITDFKKKTGKMICLSFTQSRMFLAVPYTEKLFEPAVFKTLIDFAPVVHYFEHLALVLGIVDDFNLNTRIWTKV